MQQEKLIILLDASALKHLACPLKFYRTLLMGYRKQVNSVDIVYGQAFHLFVQTMVNTNGSYPEAIKKAVDLFNNTPYTEKATKKWMTPHHLTKTCMDYWEHYNGTRKDEWQTLRVEGKALTELKFATLPYYEDERVSIILAGTIDDICKREGGCYAIRDYKTTSSWNADEYLRDYILSPQLIFYVFVLYWYAKTYPDSIYSQITREGRVAAFIDGIFLKSGATSATSAQTKFQRSEMFFFTDRDLKYFGEMLDNVVVPKILAMLDREPYPEGRLNGACNIVYGHCDYFNACAAPDRQATEAIIRNEFITKPYNPLQFD